ncbi:MAG: aerial mycelium formation protein [Acidimicrobiales bacterium]
MHADLQRLLDRDLTPDPAAVPLPDLRRIRNACSDAEGDVSLTRRVVQGRLDIVGHELRRRSGSDDEAAPAPGVLYDIPELLAEAGDRTAPPGRRRVGIGAPGAIAGTLLAEVDRIASPETLGSLDRLDTDALRLLVDRLRDYETGLSETRRRLHDRIDVIQVEIARRYRDGEASVDSLLG